MYILGNKKPGSSAYPTARFEVPLAARRGFSVTTDVSVDPTQVWQWYHAQTASTASAVTMVRVPSGHPDEFEVRLEAPSSERYKYQIVDLNTRPEFYAAVMSLRPATFFYNEDTGQEHPQLDIIAESLDGLSKEIPSVLVHSLVNPVTGAPIQSKDEEQALKKKGTPPVDAIHSYKPRSVIALLVHAVQTQHAMIQDLQKRVAELENERV